MQPSKYRANMLRFLVESAVTAIDADASACGESPLTDRELRIVGFMLATITAAMKRYSGLPEEIELDVTTTSKEQA